MMEIYAWCRVPINDLTDKKLIKLDGDETQSISTANMAITETAAKVGLCCCTFAFTFVGLGLILLGAYLATMLHLYSEFLPPNISVAVPGTLLVMVGIVVIIIAVCGFCGTSRESPFVICMFALLLLIILVMEMAGGIVAYKSRGSLQTELGDAMFRFQSIATTPGVNQARAMKSWDYIQPSLQCCGTENYEDWIIIFETTVPKSCDCDLNTVPAPRCTTTEKGSTVFSKGCRNMLLEYMLPLLAILGAIGSTIVVIEVLGLVCAVLLYRSFIRRRNFYVRIPQ